MATLTGYKPAETYKDLLHMSNSNNGVDTVSRQVYDGEGHPTPLELSTTVVNFRTDGDFKFKIGGTAISATGTEINQLSGVVTGSNLATQLTAKQDTLTFVLNNFVVGGSIANTTTNKTASEVATMMGLGTCAYSNTGNAINQVLLWKDSTGSTNGFVYNDSGATVKTPSQARTSLGIGTGDTVTFGNVTTAGYVKWKAGANQLVASSSNNGEIAYVKYQVGSNYYAKLQMVIQDNVGSYAVHDIVSKTWT